MRTLGLIEPQMLIVAAFSRHPTALAWARQRLTEYFGPIGIDGPTIAFESTEYYAPSMGHGLSKQYLAFDVLQGPDQLAAVKRRTIELEHDLAAHRDYAEARPLNLDPGFLGLGKFVLATTKDQAHRVYLHGGIFAEVTLRYHDGNFEPQPWTYPDWYHPDVIAFLRHARTRFSHLRTNGSRPAASLPPLLIPQNGPCTDH